MIRLTGSQVKKIRAHLELAYPNEGCGLLIGTRKSNGDTTVTRIVPAPNQRTTDATNRFEVAPKLQFDLMRELEGGDEMIVGHFHSHPDGQAHPSQSDEKMALDKAMIWLIASVWAGAMKDLNAFEVVEEGKSLKPTNLVFQ